jgi:hypothetical protein
MALFSCGDSECHRCSAQPGPVVAEQTEFSWARVAEDAAPVHSPTTKAVVKRQGFIASSSKKNEGLHFVQKPFPDSLCVWWFIIRQEALDHTDDRRRPAQRHSLPGPPSVDPLDQSEFNPSADKDCVPLHAG